MLCESISLAGQSEIIELARFSEPEQDSELRTFWIRRKTAQPICPPSLLAFPAECEDGGLNSGCNIGKLKGALAAYNLIWPADWPNREGQVPADPHIFDLIEFSYEHVALPEPYGFHSYWRHDHFNYDQEKGRAQFAEEINRVFERQGLAFELVHGEVTRIAPTGLQEALAETVFKSGDDDLDRLLETAREKFLNKSLDVRKEGLESSGMPGSD